MRFFYVPQVKRYIFLPAVIVFIVTLLMQFSPMFFMKQLGYFASVKNHLGYTTTFFPDNTFLVLRLLFSLFYGFIAGVIGLLLFRFKNRKSGYTILLSDRFHALAGMGYLLLMYALLNSNLFAINPPGPVNLPRPDSKQIMTPQFLATIRSYLIPNIKVDPQNVNRSRSSNTNTPNAGASGNTNPNSPQRYPYNPPPYQAPQSQPQQTGSRPQNQPQPAKPQPPRMANPTELFNSLNVYRQKNGRSPLQWDAQLANYSQQRANLYVTLGRHDSHAGFDRDADNGLNYKFKFFGLGENSSYGAVGDGRYIIEEWFGKSAPHNNSQLDSRWTHVGFGVSGSAVNVVFGGGKTDTFHVD